MKSNSVRMIHRKAICFASGLILGFATPALAQDEPSSPALPDSAPYLKAFELVRNGEPEEGKAMVDSLLKLTKPGTPAYAEGLYWRGRLVSIGPPAEKDYRRIIVDYSLSHRVPDALLRLGQLELTRGERDAAVRHFYQITKNYPSHPQYPRANYWLARALLEQNAYVRGCAVNAEAAKVADSTDIELRNQIEFQSQQCIGVKFTAADIAPKPASAKPATPAKRHPQFAEAPEEAEESARLAAAAAEEKRESGSTETPTITPGVKSGTKPTPPTKVGEAKSSEEESASKGAFTVQVAAFQTKSQANTMVAELKANGHTGVRIHGTKAPFRIHIGRYKTREAAAAALAELKEQGLDGFVTQG